MSVLAVFSRHPRYSILLFGLLVTLFFMLSSSRGPSSFGDVMPPPPPPPPSLKARIAEEEKLYQVNLKERVNMIKKWGPTIDKIQAFPDPTPTAPFYTLWDFFLPAFQCPHRVERIGIMGDGGKYTCGLDRVAKQKECVIYSFGVNGESSFESTLLTRAPGCQVWGYDFSVNSWGPEIASSPSLSPRSHFASIGLGPKNEKKNVEMPWNPSMEVQFHTLQELMSMNGHAFIDILKIDIEGAEFESLNSFMDSLPKHPHGSGGNGEVVMPIGQLQIEIHARYDGYEHFGKFKEWFERLESFGLRPFYNEPNLVYVNLVRGSKPDLVEYSFMNIRGTHALTTDHYGYKPDHAL